MKRFVRHHWRRITGSAAYLIVAPLVTVVLIGIVTTVGVMSSNEGLEQTRVQEIDKQVEERSLRLVHQLDLYEQLINSSVGRLASGPIDADQWDRFIMANQLNDRLKGLYAVGVIRQQDNVDGVLPDLSAQYGRDITIQPRTDQPIANVMAYIAPQSPALDQMIGFNVRSDPPRSAIIDRATDTGEIAASGKMELIRDVTNGATLPEPGILLYAPFYDGRLPTTTVEERRRAVLGHIMVAIRLHAGFDQMYATTNNQHVSKRVYIDERGDDNLVYEASMSVPTRGVERHRTTEVPLHDRKFVIDYSFDSHSLISQSQRRIPWLIAGLGTVLAVLSGGLMYLMLRTRHHRVLLDKERDVARAKDELLSLASHQLRTPATGVKQYVGMVLQGFAGTVSAQQKTLLEKAYESNERQLRIINDILHLAKLDMGRLVLAKSNFDLAQMIRDVADEQDEAAKSGEIKLRTRLLRKAPIYADEHALRMVVENIVSNAIKYTNPGGAVTIRLYREHDGYMVSVKDTGVGIDEVDFPRLFKQFSRVPNTRSYQVGGTGVGLYLAERLSRLHGGSITVSSKPGKGSTFLVYLPRDEQGVK